VPVELGPNGGPELARALMGLDSGPFAFPLFVRRAAVFCTHGMRLADRRGGDFFYERLRSLHEVVRGVTVFGNLLHDGITFGHTPQIELSVEIFPSMFDAPRGRVPMPSKDEQSIGGHAVSARLIDGGEITTRLDFDGRWGARIRTKCEAHRGRGWILSSKGKPRVRHADSAGALVGGRVVFDHTWGEGWGDRGMGSFSLEYVERFALEAMAVRAVAGPPPAWSNADDPEGYAESAARFRAHYIAWQSPWTVVDHGETVVWCGRWIMGVGSVVPWLQAVLLLRGVTADTLQVGWLHARGTPGLTLDIEEFFIWPPYRGQGLGSALAGQSVLFAAQRGYKGVRWMRLYADVVVDSNTGGKLPGWAESMLWQDADVGLGVACATERMDVVNLLTMFASHSASGGVRAFRRGNLTAVGTHGSDSLYSVCVEVG
jgi:GNAT superfamily N-acetyltransferase